MPAEPITAATSTTSTMDKRTTRHEDNKRDGEWVFSLSHVTGKDVFNSAKDIQRRTTSTRKLNPEIILRPGTAVLLLNEANQLFYHEAFYRPAPGSTSFVPRCCMTLRHMSATACVRKGWWSAPGGQKLDRQRAIQWVFEALKAYKEQQQLLIQDWNKLGRSKSESAKAKQPRKARKVSKGIDTAPISKQSKLSFY